MSAGGSLQGPADIQLLCIEAPRSDVLGLLPFKKHCPIPGGTPTIYKTPPFFPVLHFLQFLSLSDSLNQTRPRPIRPPSITGKHAIRYKALSYKATSPPAYMLSKFALSPLRHFRFFQVRNYPDHVAGICDRGQLEFPRSAPPYLYQLTTAKTAPIVAPYAIFPAPVVFPLPPHCPNPTPSVFIP